MPSSSTATSARRTLYHTGTPTVRMPASSSTVAGICNAEKVKATTISQKTQRQRRTIPTPSKTTQSTTATRNTVTMSGRRSAAEGCSISVCR